MIHSSLLRQIILEKVGERLNVRFPHSKMDKIWDFLKLGQTPPSESRLDFFGWKVLGCGCFDVWVVFGWFLLDFETPPPAFPAFSMLCSAILVNLWARGGVRGPWEGPCWFVLIEKLSGMALFDVWKGFELVSVHLRQLFFGHLSLFICMYGDLRFSRGNS